jgi:hypothetical protein
MGVKRITIHRIEIEDTAGSLQRLLSRVALAKVDLECFAAFSTGRNLGEVYVSAADARDFEAYASQTAIETREATGFIIGGENKVGAAAAALESLAEAGISGVAGAAMVCEGGYRMLVVVDASDGDAAARVLGV